MLSALALLIALACVSASAIRLKHALVPTGWAPEVLAAALGTSPDAASFARLEQTIAGLPRAPWEGELFDALRAPAAQRAALVNEQLTELDHRVQRWVRVPRVCASICTSSGFLLAATVLRASLAAPAEAMDAHAVDAAVLQAIDVAAVGLAGAAFCVAIQMRARKAAATSLRAFDKLVERLERARGAATP